MQYDHEIVNMSMKMDHMSSLLRDWTRIGTYISIHHQDVPVKDLLLRTCSAIPKAKQISRRTFLELRKNEGKELDYIKGNASNGNLVPHRRPLSSSSYISTSRDQMRSASPTSVKEELYENKYEELIQRAKLDANKITEACNDDHDDFDNIICDGSVKDYDVSMDSVRWSDDGDDGGIHCENMMSWELPNVTSTPTKSDDKNERHISWGHDLHHDVDAGKSGSNNGRKNFKYKGKKIKCKKKKSERKEKEMDADQDWFKFLKIGAKDERSRSNMY